MKTDFYNLRNELAKTDNHETSFLRGCIADLIKDKADRNLLNSCLSSGILQDFFREATPDSFFIHRCKTKLIEEYSITEAASGKAISFCKFLTGEDALSKYKIETISNIPLKPLNQWVKIPQGTSRLNNRMWDKSELLWIVHIDDDNYQDIEVKELADGKFFYLLWFSSPENRKVGWSIPINGEEDNEQFEFWECTANCSFQSGEYLIEKGTKTVRCYSID